MGGEELGPGGSSPGILQRALLACGILYSGVYAAANDLVAAARYPGYSRLSQAVSELSATGAPTKSFLTAMLPVFVGLMLAFGAGLLKAARGRRALTVTGGLFIAHALTAPLWLLAPMSQRDLIAAGGGTTQDTFHIVLAALTVVFILSQLGFGAAAFGWRFRLYSLLSAVIVIAGGVSTGVQSSRMAAGQLTPWLGLTERIGMVAWLGWMAVLAIVLLREVPFSASSEAAGGARVGGAGARHLAW
jgi:hypothetical protein